MNNRLVHLIAFWSACFISSSQDIVTIRVGMRNRLIELLKALPPSVHGTGKLCQIAETLVENESVGVHHPVNQEMLGFLIEHEQEIPVEFRENVENIKSFFRQKGCQN